MGFMSAFYFIDMSRIAQCWGTGGSSHSQVALETCFGVAVQLFPATTRHLDVYTKTQLDFGPCLAAAGACGDELLLQQLVVVKKMFEVLVVVASEVPACNAIFFVGGSADSF